MDNAAIESIVEGRCEKGVKEVAISSRINHKTDKTYVQQAASSIVTWHQDARYAL